MTTVRLLFAPESVAIAEKISAALAACGFEASRNDAPSHATLVVWSASASASPAILSAARGALARRVLVPVALGKAPPPPSFEHLWPMDLCGWDGSIDDPRWKFVLDEIDFAIRRGDGAEIPATGEPPPPVAKKAAKAKTRSRPEPAAAPSAFEDVFTEPHSHAASARPRPRIPVAAMFSGFAIFWLVSGGAYFVAREATRNAAASSAAPQSTPVIAFVQPDDQPTDDKLFEEPEFSVASPDAASPSAEDAPEDVFAAGAAPGAPSSDTEIGPIAEPLRDGAPPAILEIPALGEAVAAGSLPPPDDAPPLTQPDAIAEVARDATTEVAQPAGLYLRDCVECPDLAEIGAGAVAQDPTAPSSDLVLRRRIAMAVRETSYDDWARCVADGGCPALPGGGSGGGKRPVVNVSWKDAQAYVSWLTQKTGRAYRLPTESEWDYAARGGAPAVPSNAANGFGLYDMTGGVAEWTADCWTGAAPEGGVITASDGPCSARSVKGGAGTQTSGGDGGPESARRNNIGFRVVRDLP